jgi:hypothetical protein
VPPAAHTVSRINDRMPRTSSPVTVWTVEVDGLFFVLGVVTFPSPSDNEDDQNGASPRRAQNVVAVR